MEDRLGRLLAMTAKVVREQFDQDLCAVGSSLNTYVILRTVDAQPGLSQRQIAARLGIEGPTLTHHLDRLARDGLIQRVRNPDDRRMYSVELTTEGLAHVGRVETHAVQLDQELRGLFSADEVATLFALLNRVRDHYCKESKEADVHAAR